MASPTDPVGQELLEPIAVIGFSLKFPQEATTAQSFWTMLQEKRCAMTEWPRDRLNLDAYHHLDKNRNDTVRLYLNISSCPTPSLRLYGTEHTVS